MPAIAPPLNPPLEAFIPITVEPAVLTGAMKPWVVVIEAVCVAVDKVVPRTAGVAVSVAQMDVLPKIHWLL